MATWYWIGEIDYAWETLGNWKSNADGTGSSPTTIPWATADTAADDLMYGTSYSNFPIIYYAELGNGFTITGTCSLFDFLVSGEYTHDGGIIYGGTFTGDYITFQLGGTCYGGTFSGNPASVGLGGIIYGGVFSGGFGNYKGTIYGGTFSGANFINGDENAISTIYGGTFSGANFSNGYTGDGWSGTGIIEGGTFTGADFANLSGSTIYGGTFSGMNFTNQNAYIFGGTFTGDNFVNQGSGNINGGTFTGANFWNNVDGYIEGGTFTGVGFSSDGGLTQNHPHTLFIATPTAEGSRNTDPGVANVLTGTNYKIHNVNKAGSLEVPTPAEVAQAIWTRKGRTLTG